MCTPGRSPTIYYVMPQPEQAEEYAQRARDLIMGMPEQGTQVRNYENNTRLNISVYIQDFVYAADLLADWTPQGSA